MNTVSTVNRLSRWLAVVVVLQALILLGQWAGPHYGTVAQAQLADPGAQRAAGIDEQRKTNDKLDKLIGILESGNLQVKVAASDEKKEK